MNYLKPLIQPEPATHINTSLLNYCALHHFWAVIWIRVSRFRSLLKAQTQAPTCVGSGEEINRGKPSREYEEAASNPEPAICWFGETALAVTPPEHLIKDFLPSCAKVVGVFISLSPTTISLAFEVLQGTSAYLMPLVRKKNQKGYHPVHRLKFFSFWSNKLYSYLHW